MKLKLNAKFLKSYAFGLIFVFVWFAIAKSLISPIQTDTPNVWEIATHDLYGFSIEYPLKWKVETYGENGYRGFDDLKLLISDGSITSIFSIYILYRESQDASLNDVRLWGDEQIKENRLRAYQRGEDDFEEVFQNKEILGDKDVIRLRYSFHGNMYEEIYFAHNNKMLIIRLQSSPQAFEENLENFNRIVDSLTFTE
ncbi:MAG: hypothetical protein H6654_17475 [Ardenticatenaceae bacterium]|nr:hypothetical protein [Anaerolineales bacterium]MCB8938338.1 hypothetical protein [Ardenticatenaceae bacterium]MCB8975355.1 hypothetical protein [Ardenticatenaceae bacterium]